MAAIDKLDCFYSSIYLSRNTKNCKKCASKTQRRVGRPSYVDLMVEIENTNYVQVGKKYGVSDNAIRKWKKQYEK